MLIIEKLAFYASTKDRNDLRVAYGVFAHQYQLRENITAGGKFSRMNPERILTIDDDLANSSRWLFGLAQRISRENGKRCGLYILPFIPEERFSKIKEDVEERIQYLLEIFPEIEDENFLETR